MAKVINTIFQLKRGDSFRWLELNPILQQGEPGFEIDTGKLKIGDGVHTWTELLYVGESNILNIDSKQNLPTVGDINIIYRVIDESTLYQWNNDVYEPLNSGESDIVNVNNLVQDEGDYLIFYGGSATDNI